MRGETGTMVIFTRSDQPQSLTRDCKARSRCQAVWRSHNTYSGEMDKFYLTPDSLTMRPLMTDCAEGNDGSSLSGDQSPLSPG